MTMDRINQKRRDLEIAARMWATCVVGNDWMESYERNLLDAVRALDD